MSEILLLSGKLRYRIFRDPVDMRKSFNGLGGLIYKHLGKDIRGERILFFFFNKPRNTMKAILYEETRMTILHCKLHEGSFVLPRFSLVNKHVDLEPVMLMSLLQGLELHRIKIVPNESPETPAGD
jgi:transposase